MGKSLVFSGLYPSINLGSYVPKSQGTVVDDTGECLVRSRRESRAHSFKKVGRLSNNGPTPCKCYVSEEKDFLNASVITLRERLPRCRCYSSKRKGFPNAYVTALRGKAPPMHVLQL